MNCNHVEPANITINISRCNATSLIEVVFELNEIRVSVSNHCITALSNELQLQKALCDFLELKPEQTEGLFYG